MYIRPYNNISPIIGKNTYIDPTAVVIGDCDIGNDCSIWPTTVIRGDINAIRIGNETNVQDGSILHVTHEGLYGKGSPLIIGNQVTIGHGVILHACTVQDRCLIGMRSTVLDQAVIEPLVILGAGSLVPEGKILESGYMYFGSPAKKIRKLTNEEKEFLAYSAAHYCKLKNSYLTKSIKKCC